MTLNNLKQHLWEEVPCDWCGNTEYVVVLRGPDRLENLPGVFQLVKCTECGLLRQNPRLHWSSLKHYYPEGYISHGILVKEQKSKIKQLDIRYGSWKRLKAIERYKKGGKLLEIGSGSGLFLEEALRHGRWVVTGVEPSERAAKYSEKKLKVPVLNGRLSDFDLPPESYDVIVLWNVLEHLQNPIKELNKIHSLLKSDGLLVASVPNMESVARKVFKEFWVGYDLPRHLYLFPRQLLVNIINQTGFSWLDERCISTSYSTLGISIQFYLQSRKMNNKLREGVIKTYYSLPLRASLIPFLWILDKVNSSTIITFFAHKISK